MAGLSLSFILLAAFLGALSFPLPNSPASLSATFAPPVSDPASNSPAVLARVDPPPAPKPSQLDITSPIGFDDLSAPSEGAKFTDFAAAPTKRDPNIFVPSKRHIIKARLPNFPGEALERKRSFIPSTEKGRGKHGFFGGFADIFQAKAAKGKGAKAAKAAKAPATKAAAAAPQQPPPPAVDDAQAAGDASTPAGGGQSDDEA